MWWYCAYGMKSRESFTTMSAIVIHASGGALEVVALKKGAQRLKQLQGLVGGRIELLPHRDAWDAKWVGYANDEGVMDELPSNPVAFSVLQRLGFLNSTLIPGAYAGNVIVLAKGSKALTEKQVTEIKSVYADVLAKDG